MPRSMINRFGVVVETGGEYYAQTPRNGKQGPFKIAKITAKGDYAKAYGAFATFTNGGTAGIDDLTRATMKTNPKNKRKRTAAQVAATRKLVALNKARRLTKAKTRAIRTREKSAIAMRRVTLKKNSTLPYRVEIETNGAWKHMASFLNKADAVQAGRAAQRLHRLRNVRVVW